MFNRDLIPNPQAYELKRKKDKGHVATTSQPLKPSTELKSNDL